MDATLSPLLVDLPTYMYDTQFWLALLPVVVTAFVLGYIWRLRPRRYLTFWRPSALDPTLGQVSDDTLASLSQAVKLTPEAIHTYMGSTLPPVSTRKLPAAKTSPRPCKPKPFTSSHSTISAPG